MQKPFTQDTFKRLDFLSALTQAFRRMKLEFTLKQRLAGFSLASAGPEELAIVAASDLVPPGDAFRLSETLEHLHNCLFSFVPQFPSPSQIDHLIMIIRPDLSGIVYINEGGFKMQVKLNRSIEAGQPVYAQDIEGISSFDMGMPVDDDCAVVVVRSKGWKRSVYFDFGPLHEPPVFRSEPLDQVLARQEILLLGILDGASVRQTGNELILTITKMAEGYQKLRSLIAEKCETESAYQVLLSENPWMLGGQYEEVRRHIGLDDINIPDFTAHRSWDKCHDILELKQPFTNCFLSRGDDFTAEFNRAWNQAERYIAFTRRQRDYLREEKKLRFENPRCILIIGYNLNDDQLKKIREKESIAQSINVITYDQLLNIAQRVLYLMRLSSIPVRDQNCSVDNS